MRTNRLSSTVLALLLACALASTTQADFVATANLSGANEAPTPNASTATGVATVIYNAALAEFLYTVTFAGLSAPATASHIHLGFAGISGPVILPFTNIGPPAATSGTFSGTLTSADLINQGTSGITTIAQAAAAMQAGQTYVNIHDANFPGGEIRGQLTVAPGAVPESGNTVILLGLALGALLFSGARVRRT